MKITSIKTNDALKNEIVQLINNAEDKNEAVFEAIDKVVTAQYSDLINQLVAENEQAAHDADYRKALNLPVLSKDEKAFIQAIKVNPKQAVSANQVDIIPTETINRTMEALHQDSDVLSLVNFAPANVKKWLSGAYSGAAVWGELTAAVTAELTASISAVDFEVNSLLAYIPVPKAIRELADDFAMKFFVAVLSQAMRDGLEAGYINGNGKNAPIGLTKKIDAVNQDGTHQNKTKLTTITKFSPKGLAPVRTALTNNGKRNVPFIALICNPADEAAYIDPALFGEKPEGGYKNVSFVEIKKYPTPNCPEGTAIFTIPNHYIMGLRNVRIDEYKETKALEQLDLFIGSAYGNGRADDDNVAVVFDPTELEEYIPAFRAVSE